MLQVVLPIPVPALGGIQGMTYYYAWDDEALATATSYVIGPVDWLLDAGVKASGVAVDPVVSRVLWTSQKPQLI